MKNLFLERLLPFILALIIGLLIASFFVTHHHQSRHHCGMRFHESSGETRKY